MRFFRQKPRLHVLQYSNFERNLYKPSYRRLTLQEIELQSHVSSQHIDSESNWTVFFKPTLRVLATTTATSIYYPTKSTVTSVASSVKTNTIKHVRNGSVALAGVKTMPKTGFQYLEESIRNGLMALNDTILSSVHSLQINITKLYQLIVDAGRFCKSSLQRVAMTGSIMYRQLKSIFVHTTELIADITKKTTDPAIRLQKYISENFVLALLILFITAVSILTIVQTVLYFVAIAQ